MKNITINFYKLLVPAILLFEVLLFSVIRYYGNLNLSIVFGLIVLPPTTYLLFKQLVPDITLPKSLLLIYFGIAMGMCVLPLRGYINGIGGSSAYGFVFLSVATFFIISKNRSTTKPYLTMFYLLIGASVMELPIRLYDFTGTLSTLPDYLIHLLGITAGVFLYEREKLFQKINLSVSVLLVLFVYFYGYDLWMNKLSYGSYTGSVYQKAPADVRLTDANNANVSFKKGKLTVVDFWFPKCGPCLAAFPEFQKYYNKYKNNPKVEFYSANQPARGEDITESFQMLKQRGYTFPMVSAGYDKSMAKALDIRAYPTTAVIDADGYVIYKGDIKGAMSIVKIYLQPDNDIGGE